MAKIQRIRNVIPTVTIGANVDWDTRVCFAKCAKLGIIVCLRTSHVIAAPVQEYSPQEFVSLVRVQHARPFPVFYF